MSMLMCCLIARRRLFWAYLVALIWLILGVANYIVLANRVSPLSWADVNVLTSVFSIMDQYMTVFQIILVIVALVLCIGISVYLYRRVPRVRRRDHWFRDSVVFGVLVGGTVGICLWTGYTHTIFENTGNITLTFQKSGFVYAFSNSIVDTGIKIPLNYTERGMKNLKASLKEYDSTKLDETQASPNIILVQLESFFDVNNMKNYTYSEDPIPNFHKLMQEYSCGLLTVPTIGAGTVNTEFEVLTGMTHRAFGLCEYPYKTILSEQTCESIAYNLQERGYHTAVVHNNKGSFYGRNDVFANLGFDVFDSMEYMYDLEYNLVEWVKDDVLVDEIVTRMEMTDMKDFVFAITVQSHGKYPSEKIDETQTITLEGEPNEAIKNGFEYYINQCKEVDDFIGHLIEAVDAIDEESMIIFYGDHLPTLEIEDSDLQFQNTYQTNYVIWDNFGLDKKNADIKAYQLTSEIMAKLGFANGIMTKYHQVYKYAVNYEKYMEVLQYDMLYGEKYIYDGVDKYVASDLQMGLYEITLDMVRQSGDGFIVGGDNFTEFSQVYVNGKKQDTEFINKKALRVADLELETGDRVLVKQITSSGGTLSYTDEFIYLMD